MPRQPSSKAVFDAALDAVNPAENKGARHWFFVPYDQLSDQVGPLSRMEPSDAGLILIESRAWACRRPYHRQKLALAWANQRHFALEQAGRGVAVRYVPTRGTFAEVLERHARDFGRIGVMRPAERELRVELAPLFASGALEELPHEGWLTAREDFLASAKKGPPYRMDAFYRRVRQRTGILMEDGSPVGGKYSFDAENRESWSGTPAAPVPPRFRPDDVTREVAEFIARDYSSHPGEVDLDHLPATANDARRLWKWVRDHCMEHFGAYEDAMSTRSAGLFHTRISPLLNIHRITPRRVVDDVAAMDIPLNSKEGFIRQVLGWREFVRHVHEETDGFRLLPGGSAPVAGTPGDAGYAAWAGKPWQRAGGDSVGDGGSLASHLGAAGPLPPAYWGTESGLACLDHVVSGVWDEAWSHHITRLMVLSNLATLLGISPRDVTDWFWVAYADAYDWVVEPNVMGMGLFAAGDLMTTKPYVSGAAYIDRMSDYCGHCAFHPRKDCPWTRLYWAFLARHEDQLQDNRRLFMPLNTLRKRSAANREYDAVVYGHVRSALARGDKLVPEDMPKPPGKR